MRKSNSKIEIQQAITEIENPYPADDLITDYKNFLKVRDILKYYKFNDKVFESLVTLTYTLWNSTQRINRLSFLQTIRNYGYYRESKSSNYSTLLFKGTHSLETNKKLFSVFQDCFSSTCKLSSHQKEKILALSNSMLVNVPLELEEEKWLTENVHKSPYILNRVLRYPKKSAIISSWVTDNFEVDKYRTRRAEMIGWIIDHDPTFTIDKQILIDDFEYINTLDKKIVEDYLEDNMLELQLAKDLKGIIPFGDKEETSGYSLKYQKRFYAVPMEFHRDFSMPNFETLTEEFHKNIETNLKLSMIWGIAYSRVDGSLKSDLLKPYYSEETYLSLLRVGKKYKLVELLKWMAG